MNASSFQLYTNEELLLESMQKNTLFSFYDKYEAKGTYNYFVFWNLLFMT